MTIKVTGDVLKVRARFTDREGNFSNYAQTSISVERCTDGGPEITDLPLSDTYLTTPVGCLAGSAEYIDGNYVRLTENTDRVTGQVAYKSSALAALTFQQYEFDFMHDVGYGAADGVYLYFKSAEIPLDEVGTIVVDNIPSKSTGYVIGFSEWHNQIFITYKDQVSESASFTFAQNTWYHAKIKYNQDKIRF